MPWKKDPLDDLGWLGAMRMADAGLQLGPKNKNLQQGRDETPSRRRKIWEIQGMYHCSIVGTCLTLQALRKLARKIGIPLDKSTTDIEVHQIFVKLAGDRGNRGKLLNKNLDKRYKTAIDHFSKASTAAELNVLWCEALEEGNIPGPYWALMSHPCVDSEMISRAFGDIHMLSHLVGASNRADIRQIRRLEQQLSEMQDRLDEASSKARSVILESGQQVAELQVRLKDALRENKELEALRERLGKLEDGEELRLLQVQLEDQASIIDAAEIERKDAATREKKLEEEIIELARQNNSLQKQTRHMKEGMQILEELLTEALLNPFPENCDDRGTDRCPGPSLCGRRILYVGGRKNLVDRYRQIIERQGGEFIYHDGGIEESVSCLFGSLERADVVVCPIDCISHNATRLAKQHCKQDTKPFFLLRNAGMSSLVSCLKKASIVLSADGDGTRLGS
jgi:hypothetical protein